MRLIRKTLNYIRSYPTNKQTGSGSEPCILTDVKIIIESMPYHYEHTEVFSSLFLFAIYTGARSDTWCSIQHKDIKSFTIFKNQKSSLLSINLTTMKSHRNKLHAVTFEEYENAETSINFIYWLRLHLIINNFQLNKIMEWNLREDEGNYYL